MSMKPVVESRTLQKKYLLTYYIQENPDSDRYIVYLNGLFHGYNSWRKQINCSYLKRNYNQIFIDYQGFGGSSEDTSETVEYKNYIEDICDILEQENISRFDLTGYSVGGMFAAGVADRYPEMIDRLVLVNTSVSIKNHALVMIKGIAGLLSENVDIRRIFAAVYPWYYSGGYLEKLMDLEKDVLDTYAAYNHSRRGMLRMLNALKHLPDLAPFFSRIRKPVMVISGDEDYIFPVSSQHEIRACIPHAEHHIISGCGHSSYIEKSNEFNRVLETFLKKGD